MQGLACMFAQNSFMAQLTDLEMLSMILACVMHDAGHPGALSESNYPPFALQLCLMMCCQKWNQCMDYVPILKMP